MKFTELKLAAVTISAILIVTTLYVLGIEMPPLPSLLSENQIREISQKKGHTVSPCKVCRSLVSSFEKGLENTARGKYEGGDTFWEESRLKSYSDSELRLVEIQEKLCSDIGKGENQCHNLAEEYESTIEEWWFKKRKHEPDLFKFLCIDNLQVCCPKNHYGPTCSPCKGVEKPCNGHGKCKGEGTRKGSGKCICDSGYFGTLCEDCKPGYFKASNTEGEICEKCHVSCKERCRGPGPQGCEVCAEGYSHDPENGCIDIDECTEKSCSENEFCVNNEGSYSCSGCDAACDGCTGHGPENCLNCQEGFHLKDNKCVDQDMEEVEEIVKTENISNEAHAEL